MLVEGQVTRIVDAICTREVARVPQCMLYRQRRHVHHSVTVGRLERLLRLDLQRVHLVVVAEEERSLLVVSLLHNSRHLLVLAELRHFWYRWVHLHGDALAVQAKMVYYLSIRVLIEAYALIIYLVVVRSVARSFRILCHIPREFVQVLTIIEFFRLVVDLVQQLTYAVTV